MAAAWRTSDDEWASAERTLGGTASRPASVSSATFRTDHPGVELPQRVRAQYPQEMTIVLQHQFWDLALNRETQSIEVGLSFGGVPSKLAIPLDAVVEFADPHIRYGLRFQAEEAPTAEEAPPPPPDQPEPPAEKDTEPGQVVSHA